jgi:hypothetical protein
MTYTNKNQKDFHFLFIRIKRTDWELIKEKAQQDGLSGGNWIRSTCVKVAKGI